MSDTKALVVGLLCGLAFLFFLIFGIPALAILAEAWEHWLVARML